ncbi:MAG: hypothetical protein Q8Q89_02615 [bacterium]|nr:hypothetical protein [bacterium]
MYLQRKDLLLRQKAKFEESFKDFGQQRKNWVEPLRSFVLSLKEAVDLEKSENYLEWKTFFQKIGSNPEIKDKTLSCNWGELWEFTASAVDGKGFEKIDSAILASAKSLRFLNSDNVSFGGVCLKKSEPILRRTPTNEDAPPPPCGLGGHQRKMFLAFRICARPISSKKERTFFFGVLPSKYSGRWRD